MKISKEATIISVIAIVFVIVLGILIWKSPSFVANPITKADETILVRPNSHMTGQAEAKVTMVEFGDYQCPACEAAYAPLQSVVEAYKANPDFNFVFRNFPLPQHPYAKPAAEAAEAAGAQGKFWEMHDKLYEGWNDWQDNKNYLPIFVGYAQSLGLDTAKFQKEVTSEAYKSNIDADLADVSKLGLDHTPTVFINGEEQTDLSPATLSAKIDSLLKQ